MDDLITRLSEPNGYNDDLLLEAAERITTLEAEAKRLAQACWAIKTGRIVGEPNNHRDTMQIMRDIAAEALAETSFGR